MKDCEFNDLRYGIAFLEGYEVTMDNINIKDVTFDFILDDIDDIDNSTIHISTSSFVYINNINAVNCGGQSSCILIEKSFYANIDTMSCQSCVNTRGVFLLEEITTAILNNVYIYDAKAISSGYVGFYALNIDDLKITNSIFDSSGDGGFRFSTVANRDFSRTTLLLDNITYTNNPIPFMAFENLDYVTIDNCVFMNNTDQLLFLIGSSGALGADEYVVTNTIFKDNGSPIVKYGGVFLIQYCNTTIINCVFDGNRADMGAGIALLDFPTNPPLTIFDTVFIENRAEGQGGAIFIFGGEYQVNNVSFISNEAKISGGAIFDDNGGLTCAVSDVTPLNGSRILNTMFIDNKARQAGAGLFGPCRYWIENCTLQNNIGYIQGGGFIIDASYNALSASKYILNNIKFIGNSAITNGGGIVLSGGNILIQNCIFDSNTALSEGGAFFIQGINEFDIVTEIINTEIINNEAVRGAGLFIDHLNTNLNNDESVVSIKINKCIIDNNTATDNGGGIYLKQGTLNTMLSNITNNAANNGAGFYFIGGQYSDLMSIFRNNAAINGGGLYVNDDTYDLMNTTIMSNDATGFGGGIYMNTCPNTTSISINFENNYGLIGGNAEYHSYDFNLQNQKDCATKWCQNCEYIDNDGNTINEEFQNSPPSNLLSKWNQNDNTKLTTTTQVIIDASVYDGFDNIIQNFANDVSLSTSLQYKSKNRNSNNDDISLELFGITIDRFQNGAASLSFKIQTIELIYEYIEFDINVTIKALTFEETRSFVFVNEIYKVPNGIKVLGIFLGVLVMILVIITALITKYLINEPVIRGANPYFLFLILIGLFIGGISILLVPYSNVINCKINIWLIHLAFFLVCLPLAGKTWRIQAFFWVFQEKQELEEDKQKNTAKYKKAKRRRKKRKNEAFKWTTKRLFIYFVLIPMIILVIYLIIWSGLYWNDGPLYKQDNNSGQIVALCKINVEFVTISYLISFLFIFWLVKLAYDSRNVPTNFNASLYIATCIYVIFLIMIFLIPISLIDSINIKLKTIAFILLPFIAIVSMLIFLYFVKFAKIKGWIQKGKIVAYLSSQKSIQSTTTQQPTTQQTPK